MSLNFADRIAVIRSQPMQIRITGIVCNFALYVLNGGSASPADAANALQWAKEALLNPEYVAGQVSWHVLNQEGFYGADQQGWTAGSDITDSALQVIVETAIKSHFIAPASP